MSLVLIDTSVWIELLRGTAGVDSLSRIQNLLESGSAAWCGIIQVELWAGVGNAKERKQLNLLNAEIRSLEMTQQVWEHACSTAGLARSKGITAPPSDHAIFACARVHDIELWHNDRHFNLLAKL